LNAGSLSAARYTHSATMLPNGQVLVAGGYTGSSYLSSVEVFNPIAGAWTTTNAMSFARANHTATLLPNGQVLVAGGGTDNNILTNLVEVYDPGANAWLIAGSLADARYVPTATLLLNGQVLVAGGYAGGTTALASSEIYDVGLGFSNGWQPQVYSLTTPLSFGSSLVVTGAPFRGVSEGSTGNNEDSAADSPLVQLRSIKSERTTFLAALNWFTNEFASSPVWNFPPGYA
jgi:hypothetical protein